ncbi:hypothetical protein B0H13DRAFT_1479018, partial [Mycena leptocephala]
SDSEIFCSQLLRKKRGLPLYDPAPQINLPAAYQRNGVGIGDVGRVTPEGIFDFFFNIFLPPEHSINGNNTPEDFSPMAPYTAIDVFNQNNNYSALSRQSPLTGRPHAITHHPVTCSEFPGGDFIFICDSLQGAVLALPDGSHLQKLGNLENMRAYAAKHAESWYKYVNGPRGRGLANGDLYLVTGCEKARSWGMASY